MYVQATDSSLVNLQWSVHPWNRFHGWTFHQPLKKWKFFYELKKCFCHLVPQIKQCFGRTSFDVFTKVLASSRTMFRRRWSFLVTKRLLKDEKGLFVSSLWVFSFEKHFLHTCNWFCPQKKKMYSQLNVALKKGRENDSERKQNHFQQSQVVF